MSIIMSNLNSAFALNRIEAVVDIVRYDILPRSVEHDEHSKLSSEFESQAVSAIQSAAILLAVCNDRKIPSPPALIFYETNPMPDISYAVYEHAHQTYGKFVELVNHISEM